LRVGGPPQPGLEPAQAVFDPFAPGTFRPVYDSIDAFFVPMAGFGGVERPGPKITIYRLRPEE
jgi:hypothetical protein